MKGILYRQMKDHSYKVVEPTRNATAQSLDIH